MANPENNLQKETFEKVPVKANSKARLARRKRAAIIIGSVLLILFLLLWGAYQMILDYYVDKLNVVTKEDLQYETEVITDELPGEEVYHNGELNSDNLPLICDNKEVMNVLLLAVDSRANEAGRSDSMILLSINKKTKNIVLCSFLRDIYAKYPEDIESPVKGKYNKLNHAHAYGGPELTMGVLKETFNIDVEFYAKVNFGAFSQIIDAMGGVDMELSSAEVREINRLLTENDAGESIQVDPKDLLSPVKDGMFHLNGVQALSHARNRRVGSDWARTQRQRDLLTTMAKKATTLSLSQLNKLLNTVLPMITTNIPKDQIKDMIGDVPAYLTYDIESTKIPEEGMFREENYNIIPDLEKNCNALYEKIYGEKAKKEK